MGKYAKAIIIGLLTTVVVSALLGFLGAASGANLGVLPMWMGVVLGGLVAYLLANLTGTKAGPAATDDQKQAALSGPLEGMGRVIVFRHGFVAMAAGMNIAIDGRAVAQLKSPQWTALDLAPGAHTLKAAFTGLAEKQSNAADTAFEVRPGEVAAFRLTVSLGALKNGIKAEPVTLDDDHRRQLANAKMVAPTA